MKGIILAGGSGTRLYPMTKVMTKQLQPIYDKPMIYYPLAQLMLCDIKDVLIISTPWDLPHFKTLLGTGESYGINLQYKEQEVPRGIAEAFVIGEEFINGHDVALILGDNLFYGNFDIFRKAIKNQKEKQNNFHARIFGYLVSNPEQYGVVEFNPQNNSVISIEEKPKSPKSSFAIPGFYLFDKSVTKKAKEIKPSARGELEITAVMNSYVQENKLKLEIIGRGMAWLDTGTPQALLEANAFVGAIEQRQGLKIACLEEIAYRMKYIDYQQFLKIIESTPKSSYNEYLTNFFNTLERPS